MVYVCSDLHGCGVRTLQRLLQQVNFQQEDFLFVLGDVIDRGDWGAELLLWLTQQPNIQLILGNHEALMLTCDFLFDEVSEKTLDKLSTQQLGLVENWICNGGSPTLNGFRRLLRKDPEAVYGILDYLREAPLFEELTVNGQDFVLVHAGLDNFRINKPLETYMPEELLLNRPAFDTCYYPDKRVIFGHTPSILFGEEYRGRAVHTPSWSCVDVGVSLGNPPMLLRLDDMEEFYLK